jgi:ATP-dependent DNA ligase
MPATRDHSPYAVEVQLCTTIGAAKLEALEGSEHHWMERKLDGFRLVVVFNEDGIFGLSRSGRDQDLENRLPLLHRALRDLMLEYRLHEDGGTVLDGELIPPVPPDQAQPFHFVHVTEVMKSDPARAAMIQAGSGALCYAVFDILRWRGRDLVSEGWSLDKRRKLLEEHLDPMAEDVLPPRVSLTRTHPVDASLASEWMAGGGEGAMVKDKRSPYSPGRSTKNGWHRIKSFEDADVVCLGFTEARFGKGGKFFMPDGTPMIGAIRFGQWMWCYCQEFDPDDVEAAQDSCETCGGTGRLEMMERGRCSGMPDSMREELTRNGDEYVGRVFVVRHMGIQSNGFRHPQFRGWRTDKPSEDCMWD